MTVFADLQFNNRFAQLDEVFYTKQPAQPLPQPYLVDASEDCAELLGIDYQKCLEPAFADFVVGNHPIPESDPLAQIYSGHQFGVYNPRLGDGRGLLLGEIDTANGHWELHLKGAGMTPYSRMGDGRAVLRSSIREYLISEAMAGLGIPTTRALCVVGADSPVYREEVETAAMVLRVAKTHIRFGHLEYFFHSKQHQQLKTLIDYCLEHYYPECRKASEQESYAAMLAQISFNTAKMIAYWQAYGFCHGVMNTDNMSILGDTFDYGPYAFLDDYNPNYICNHSDHQGRYAFNQQPGIALWNLNALAHTFTPWLETETLRECLATYEPTLQSAFKTLMLSRLGLETEQEEDRALVGQLLDLLEKHQPDYTNFFRKLSSISSETDWLHEELNALPDYQQWIKNYWQRLQLENNTAEQRKHLMDSVNPKYILRNYLAQQAIDKAKEKDFSEVTKLRTLLARPFDEWPEFEDYAKPAPDWGKDMCISCSS